MRYKLSHQRRYRGRGVPQEALGVAAVVLARVHTADGRLLSLVAAWEQAEGGLP